RARVTPGDSRPVARVTPSRMASIRQLLRRMLGVLISATGWLAPEGLVQRVAAWIRGLPAERLESIMRSPVRRAVLDGIFWQMPRHLDRRRAAAVNASIRWRVTGRRDGGEDVYDLVLADGRAHVIRRGGETTPRLTITIDGAE